MFEAVLFDLDGTLADTAPDLGESANLLLAEEGHAAKPLAMLRPYTSQGVRGLLKAGFDRARPDMIAHLDVVSNASYPSGHAANTAVLYLLLAWLAPPRRRTPFWALAAAMIVLNGLSRIMLGVHWPTDVVGGTLLGAAFALLGAWAVPPTPPAGRSSPRAFRA